MQNIDTLPEGWNLRSCLRCNGCFEIIVGGIVFRSLYEPCNVMFVEGEGERCARIHEYVSICLYVHVQHMRMCFICARPCTHMWLTCARTRVEYDGVYNSLLRILVLLAPRTKYWIRWTVYILKVWGNIAAWKTAISCVEARLIGLSGLSSQRGLHASTGIGGAPRCRPRHS